MATEYPLLNEMRKLNDKDFAPIFREKLKRIVVDGNEPEIYQFEQTKGGFNVKATEKTDCSDITVPDIKWSEESLPVLYTGKLSISINLQKFSDTVFPLMFGANTTECDRPAQVANDLVPSTTPFTSMASGVSPTSSSNISVTGTKVTEIPDPGPLYDNQPEPSTSNRLSALNRAQRNSRTLNEQVKGIVEQPPNSDDALQYVQIRQSGNTELSNKSQNTAESKHLDMCYEYKVYPDKTTKLRFFGLKKKNVKRVKFKSEISTESSKKGKQIFVIEGDLKGSGAKEKSMEVLEFTEGKGLEKAEKRVLIIDNEEDYKNELLIRGWMGALSEQKKQSIQFGRYIYHIDWKDFYIYGVVGVVYTPGTDPKEQWPWKNENNDPIEPCDDKLVTYKDMIQHKHITDKRLFYLLGKANNGEFCTGTSDASPVEGQLILALTFAEPIRNHFVLIDNKVLYEKRFLIGDIKTFLYWFHPMVGTGTFRDRKTGFHGKTDAYITRRKVFYQKLHKLEISRNSSISSSE